jgi:hypothetical protein
LAARGATADAVAAFRFAPVRRTAEDGFAFRARAGVGFFALTVH